MDIITGKTEAMNLQDTFIKEMYPLFDIPNLPSSSPISFEPLLSLGGLKVNINSGFEIVLNDTFLLDPLDRLQFEQTIWHETAHILHLMGNGCRIGNAAYNHACDEPIGSIIADLGVLVFSHYTKRKTEDYFSKLSDYTGPAKELFMLVESKGFEYPRRLLREMSKQTVSGLYKTVKSYLGRNYLYADPELESFAEKQAS